MKTARCASSRARGSFAGRQSRSWWREIIATGWVHTPSTRSPQFVSWDEYQGGKKSVTICGKSERIEVKDFDAVRHAGESS